MRAGVGAWDAAGWWGTRRAGTGSGHPKRAREALTCQQSLAMSFHSWQTRANGPRHRRGARRKTRWPRSETRSTSHKLQLPHAACRRSAVSCCKVVSGPCNMAWMARCVCVSRTHVPGSSLDEPGCDGVNAGDIVCCAVDGSIIPSLRAAAADVRPSGGEHVGLCAGSWLGCYAPEHALLNGHDGVLCAESDVPI